MAQMNIPRIMDCFDVFSSVYFQSEADAKKILIKLWKSKEK